MVELTSTRAAAAAIRGAHSVRADAYILHPGAVLNALEDAARAGARVTVRLEAAPFGSGANALARANRRVVRELRACGADAALVRLQHAKEIDAGGRRFLDGKNWNDGDLVVSAGPGDEVASDKHDALAAEARLLEGGGDAIVESETFGSGNAAYAALDRLARAGASPRLLVNARSAARNPRERALLQRLQNDGVRVRVCKDDEKIAVVGDRVWLGSANASWDDPHETMSDWGLTTDAKAVVATARARLESAWSRARPLRP